MLAWVLRWDRSGRLRPLAIQDPEGQRLLEGLPVAERLASWHLVTTDRAVASAGAAFAPLFALLPAGRFPGAIVRRAPGLTDRAYRLVARNRSRLGRLVADAAKRRADALIHERGGEPSPRRRAGP